MDAINESRMYQADHPQSHKSYLKKALRTIFPSDYIQLHHTPPHTICSLFNFRSTITSGQSINIGASPGITSPYSKPRGNISTQADKKRDCVRYEASTEPMSRAEFIHLRQRFNCSLIEHQAKPVGLCPIRRILYDQMFGRSTVISCMSI